MRTAGTGRPRRGRAESIELIEVVDDDVPNTVGDRRATLRRSCCCRETSALRRRRPTTRRTSGRRWQHRAFLVVGQTRHGLAQERLRRVHRPSWTERGDGLAASCPQVGLVVDENGRAVFGDHVEHAAPADGQRTVPEDLGGNWQKRQGYRCHMRSGASMPSRSRPVRNTRAVCVHSRRRNARVCRSAFSTGQAS